MMRSRRKFLKRGAFVAAGSLMFPSFDVISKNRALFNANEFIAEKEIGVQIYSVRNELREDFEGSVAKLAEIGFKYIEAYGLDKEGIFLRNISPKFYRETVSSNGMKLIATHCQYLESNESQKMIEASQEAGLDYLVIPWLDEQYRKSVDSYKKVAENLNRLGELSQDAGIKLGYHNHAFEFEKVEGQIPLEILLNETQPELVTFEADLYWVKKGGMDPMTLINKYPGRFSLFHVKDADENLEQTTVGSGIIDFETILNNRKKAGLKYYFVEDERTDNPFKNLKDDLHYLLNSDFG